MGHVSEINLKWVKIYIKQLSTSRVNAYYVFYLHWQYCPGGHSKQSSTAVACTAGLYVPLAHGNS